MSSQFSSAIQGDLPYVRQLGGDALELERCFGVSMLWNVAPYAWTLDHLPEGVAERAWRALDRIVRTRPQHSDMIFSIWRKRGAAGWPTSS